MTKTGPVTPAELELGRRIMAILEVEVEEVLKPAWQEICAEIKAKLAAGEITIDVVQPVFGGAMRRFFGVVDGKGEFDEIDVARVETEADLPEFRRRYHEGLEAALRRALAPVRAELSRWGAAT
jgi:hypothetical protein